MYHACTHACSDAWKEGGWMDRSTMHQLDTPTVSNLHLGRSPVGRQPIGHGHLHLDRSSQGLQRTFHAARLHGKHGWSRVVRDQGLLGAGDGLGWRKSMEIISTPWGTSAMMYLYVIIYWGIKFTLFGNYGLYEKHLTIGAVQKQCDWFQMTMALNYMDSS